VYCNRYQIAARHLTTGRAVGHPAEEGVGRPALDHAGEVGTARPDGVDGRGVLGLGDGQARLGVDEDVRHLVGRGHRIGRHHHGAGLRRGHPEQEELGAVAEVDVEPIAVMQPSGEEQVGGAVDVPVEFAPGPVRRLAGLPFEEEEGRVGEAAGLVLEGALEGAGADDDHAAPMLADPCGR